jgi:hypothetical protein
VLREFFRFRARKLMHRLLDRPLAPPTAEETRRVEELRAAFRQVQPLSEEGATHSGLAWIQWSNELREKVLKEDPRGFLRWEVIIQTMNVLDFQYVKQELKNLKARPDWTTRWQPAVRETGVGHPLPYPPYPKSSANALHHAYHLAQFEDKAGVRLQDTELLFEFGGGYGSMCRLIHNLGFHGRYVIYDLPLFSALQRFYLQSVGVPLRTVDEFRAGKTGVLCLSDLEQLKALLAEAKPAARSTFIAAWSVCETPPSVRDAILPLSKEFESHLIGYQVNWGEINNVEYFGDWAKTRPEIQWNDWAIPHLPGNHYLIGKRGTPAGRA